MLLWYWIQSSHFGLGSARGPWSDPSAFCCCLLSGVVALHSVGYWKGAQEGVAALCVCELCTLVMELVQDLIPQKSMSIYAIHYLIHCMISYSICLYIYIYIRVLEVVHPGLSFTCQRLVNVPFERIDISRLPLLACWAVFSHRTWITSHAHCPLFWQNLLDFKGAQDKAN